MRLFAALDLPGDVAGRIESLLERLRPTARVGWIPVTNLHITTKFIGDWPDERLEDLAASLRQVSSHAPIAVHVRRVGFFPNPHSPRVFWCGIEAPGLDALAAATDEATASLGVAKETRPYSPHLTLARIKEKIDLQPLREAIAAEPSLDLGRFKADSFFLYRSHLKPTGSVYTKVAEFPLNRL